ncbi:hypothetical protein [Sphingobium yanoikuyae]|uniref:hypothetical protein n=1 Tax=Sphingobium yanoikuyae TaxID=13690 RepID=UPI0035C7B59E
MTLGRAEKIASLLDAFEAAGWIRTADGGTVQGAIDALDSALSPTVDYIENLGSADPGDGASLVAFRQAGAGSVARTSFDKLAEIASPQDFGAQGDNVADDRAAFVSANTRAGLTFIPRPSSKYKQSSPFATTSAAWLPDPSMTWDQLTDGGKFDMTRGFFAGSGNGANIWRLSDRLFVGHAAAHFAGSGSLPDAGDSWLKTSADGPAYLAANAQFLSMTSERRYAGVFAAKTGLSGGAGEAIGFGSIIINNGSGHGWGGIIEAQHTSTTTTTWGMEFAIKHASGVNVFSTPYSSPVAASRGIMLVGSGDNSFGPAATHPSTVGITFTTNHALGWNTGIEFRSGSIPTGEAISLANGYAFNWYESSGGISASIKSANNTAGGKLTLQFQSGGLNLLNNSGKSVLFVSAAANDVNRMQFTSGAAGVPPQIDAAGDDTNIDLRLNSKGTGRIRFGTFAASADAPITGSIEIKDAGGTVRKVAIIA